MRPTDHDVGREHADRDRRGIPEVALRRTTQCANAEHSHNLDTVWVAVGKAKQRTRDFLAEAIQEATCQQRGRS